MNYKTSEKERDRRLLVVLSKLSAGDPVSMLEMGFSATPQFLRNMAARGLVKITVSITSRGAESIPEIKTRILRRKRKELEGAPGASEAA